VYGVRFNPGPSSRRPNPSRAPLPRRRRPHVNVVARRAGVGRATGSSGPAFYVTRELPEPPAP